MNKTRMTMEQRVDAILLNGFLIWMDQEGHPVPTTDEERTALIEEWFS